MLDNHEDINEEKPQKKKRKLSNSQESININQDISFIKVTTLWLKNYLKGFMFHDSWV